VTSRAVQEGDIGSRMIRDYRLQLIKLVEQLGAINQLAYQMVDNYRNLIATEGIESFRPEIWRLDLRKIANRQYGTGDIERLKSECRKLAENQVATVVLQVLQPNEYLINDLRDDDMKKSSLAKDKPLLNGEAFHALSSFYVSVWAYMNTFFDDTRWLQTASIQTDPYLLLEKSLERIRHDEIDGIAYKQVVHDFNVVEKLRESLDEQNNKPDSNWLSRAAKMRTYSQELGLRYAEMATEH
jgi:hypothetical protein